MRFWKVLKIAVIALGAALSSPCSSQAAPTVPVLAIDDISVKEANGGTENATFTVTLSSPSVQTVTVNWTTVNGWAKAPDDFAANAGTLSFTPGTTSQNFNVGIKGDLLDEDDEAFYVLLSSPSNAIIGRGRAIATILDDDPTPSLIIDDLTLGEGNSGTRIAAFALHLSAPSGKVVKVNYATQDGTAQAGDDYIAVPEAAVSFRTGYTVALARVTVNGDLLNEPDETFLVKLSSPVNATIADAQATGTILNDDRAPSVSVGDARANEGTSALLDARLSSPSGQQITVNWKTADGTAKSASDYTALTGKLNFSPGQIRQSFTVPVQGDGVAEGDEIFYSLLSSPVGASLSRGRGIATIAANDAANNTPAFCPAITKIRFFPRAGYASRLLMGRFYGSNTGVQSQLDLLGVISEAPREGQWNEITLTKPVLYRFLKFETPNFSAGGVAELEFLSGETRVLGTPLGSSSAPGSTRTFTAAFDGDATTYFEGAQLSGQWLALDLGAKVQAAPPVFSPAPGTYANAQTVTITSPTPGAKIRITTTNADPTRDSGKDVTAPLQISSSQVIAAVAYTDTLASSPAAVGAYRITSGEGNPTGRVRTFHVGNSLTYGMDRWLQPLAQSGGKNFEYRRFAYPGSAIQYQWEHPGSGVGDTHYAEALKIYAPFDSIFTQPYAGRDMPLENEALYSQKFYDLARQSSPNVQVYLYAQWPGTPFSDNRSQGKGSAAPLNLTPAKTWQDGVGNHLKFIEAVRSQVNKTYTGKPVLIVPAGSALATLKDEVDAGRVPGMTDFFKEISADGLHLTGKGIYMISLVFYSCIFKESPEVKVGLLNSGLTAEQAQIFQRIAWQTARDYPYSGIGPVPN